MKLRFTLILPVLFLCLSCKKEEDKGPQFPAELYLTQVRKKGGIRLFTNKTELRDQALANRFTKGVLSFGVNDSTVTSEEKIVFNSSDSASMESSYSALGVKQQGDILLFESAGQGEFSEDASKVLYPMYKYRNPLGLQWYDKKYRLKILLVGHGNYERLALSVFNYRILKTQKYLFMEGIYRWEAAGKVFNEFDPSYIDSVRDTDTLAIEEYSYIFEKR